MINSMQPKLLVVLLCLVRSSLSEVKTKVRVPIKRSYGLPQVAFLNDPQGLQYYTTSPLYTALPTLFLPNQIGLSAAPITNLILPQAAEPKPAQEFLETSTSAYGPRIPTQIYSQKHRSQGLVPGDKRATTYVNSLYGHMVRMKPISSVPSHKPKVSIQPSVDLSGQYSQEAASNLYPTTVGPPVVSTYGPPKAVDIGAKTRITGAGPTVYHRLKGGSHRHPIYPMKKMRIYSHVHKDHIHSHYLPPNHPQMSYKFQTTKYAAPPYLPPVPASSPIHTQKGPAYGHETNSQVRFPENQEHLQAPVQDQEIHMPNAPVGLTQAIIKSPGVINNYDANIPIHVPSKKPYKFEVNEILKNSELHFVQEPPDTKNNEVNAHNGGVVDYSQHLPYQNAIVFSHQQPIYSPLPVDSSNIIAAPNPLDVYSLPGVSAYQSNHIASDQDLGTSETVKVPVAIIKGAHNIASQSLYGITMKRQDDAKLQEEEKEEVKKTFKPSRRTSDWIPMSGNGVPIARKEETSEESSETFRREYFSPKNYTKIVRQPVGDIISGKIPEEFSPKGGQMSFVRSSERDKRKGSVIDVSPSKSEVSKIGETSDLVVSSVIKFS